LDDAEFQRRVGALLDEFAEGISLRLPTAARPQTGTSKTRTTATLEHAPRERRRKRTLNESIAIAVREALDDNSWNKSLAAIQLGIHRSRLRRLIRHFRLTPR
jgi:DNA-binding NtrC family response regulator